MTQMKDADINLQRSQLQAKLQEADLALSGWAKVRRDLEAELAALPKPPSMPQPGSKADRILRMCANQTLSPVEVGSALGTSYQNTMNTLRDLVARDQLYQPGRGLYRTRHAITLALGIVPVLGAVPEGFSPEPSPAKP